MQTKFKVWSKKENRWLTFAEFYISPEGKPISSMSNEYDVIPIEDVVLVQFTGLFDKQKKEIYEGDIILFARGPGSFNEKTDTKDKDEVNWDKETCGFFPFASYCAECSDMVIMETVEVVGNIYETPEKLEGKHAPD